MFSKPLVRWNIGAVSYIGFDCLYQAYRNFKSLYDDSVDYAITVNSQLFKSPVVKDMERDGVEIIIVENAHFSLGKFGNGASAGEQKSGWVFAPFQLDPSRRQLTLDNDILLTRRPVDFDTFLFGEDDVFLFKEHWPYLEDWPSKSEKEREDLRMLSFYREMRKVLPPDIARVESSVVGLPVGDQLPGLKLALEGYAWRDYMGGTKGWEQAFLALLYESVWDRAVFMSYKVIPVYPRLGYQTWDETCGIHLSGINQLNNWTVNHYAKIKSQWVID